MGRLVRFTGGLLVSLQALCGLWLMLSATCSADRGPGCSVLLPHEAESLQFGLEHGLPHTIEPEPGLVMRLVAPGHLTRTAADGSDHDVWIRTPFYISDEAFPSRGYDHTLRWIRKKAAGWAPHHVRLPTEAEWMLAAETHSVPRWDPDPHLPEWCADWFAPVPPHDVSDPVGPQEGTQRVVRYIDFSRGGLVPTTHEDDIARARLVAEIGWKGNVPVTIRTVTRDVGGEIVEEVTGYRIRLIRVLDRLADRQAGRVEEWVDAPGTSPLELGMFPGRYYAVAVDTDPTGTERVGPELKIDVTREGGIHDVEVPGPRVWRRDK